MDLLIDTYRALLITDKSGEYAKRRLRLWAGFLQKWIFKNSNLVLLIGIGSFEYNSDLLNDPAVFYLPQKSVTGEIRMKVPHHDCLIHEFHSLQNLIYDVDFLLGQ